MKINFLKATKQSTSRTLWIPDILCVAAAGRRICGMTIAAAMVLALPLVVQAKIDPFSVYALNTPAGCLDKEIGTGKLTLADLIEIGICNSPTLGKGFMDVKSAESALGSATSEYLPSVSGRGEISIDHYKNENLGSSDNGPLSGSVALDWLLFDFGGRSGRTEQTRAYLDAAGFTYNALIQSTVLNVTTAYYNLLANQAILESATTSEKSYKKAYEESARKFELGLVPLNDKLLAQTSYEQSKLATIRAKNAVETASGTLAQVLNLPPETAFDLFVPKKDKNSTKLGTDKDVSELIAMAVEERSEIKAKYKQQEAYRQGIKIAKSIAMPTVSAGANVSGSDDWRRGQNPYQYGASAGIRLSVPLFTGFKNTYDISRAQYDYERAGLDIAETQDSVKNEVWTAWQNYGTSVSAYDISQKVLQSAKENQRVAFEMYQVGRGSILNLLTAESQLATARQETATAFYQVLINKANLYRAVGGF